MDFTDIRQRLAWVLAGLRHQQARESDLIYEAYYDAFRSDIPQDAADQLEDHNRRTLGQATKPGHHVSKPKSRQTRGHLHGSDA